MFDKITLEDWENLVKKQLKTEDIYPILQRENLESIDVKPYHDHVSKPLTSIPRVEESTHLVANYREDLEENVFAFLLKKNVENLQEKSIFIDGKELAEHLSPEEENRYFSLVDVFNENEKTINDHLAGELLAKDFDRKICINVSLHQNSGASIVQQLGMALAKTKDLVELYGKEILSKLSIRIAVGGNYFFEIAKIRALKLAFNQFSQEYEMNEFPFVFAETTLRNKTKNDEENNLIRSTLELASAMIGGADAVFSNNFKLENETELSDEISFKQQIVLAYESIINVFDDGANGSYYIENITQQFAEKSWKYFLELEENGGYLESLKSGKIQKEIFEQATKEQKWVEEGKIKIIGVNLYPKLEKTKNMEDLYSSTEIKPVRWAEMFE